MIKLNSFYVRVFKENGYILEQTRPEKLLDALKTYQDLNHKYFPENTNDYPSAISSSGSPQFYTDEWIENYLRNWKGDENRLRWLTRLRWHTQVALPSGIITVQCLHSSET